MERTFGPDSSILAGFSASQSIVFKRGDSAENLRKVDNEKLASEVSVIRSAIQQLDWSIEGGKETATPGAKKLEPATMMIFISHSSHDVPLTTALIDLLRLAIPELQSGQIRCSDVPGYRFPGGVNTEERIRKEVNEAKIVIALVTPSSLRSVYVLFELGARWGANLRLIPLLAGVDPGELEEPLKPLNALSAHQNEELHQLVKDVARGLGMKQDDSAIWLPKIDVVKERADATQRGRHASETLILKRNDVDGVVGTVEERFDHAQEEVWISGNDNMFVARCLSGFLVKALRRRLKIRLLGVDPDSAAASMLSLIDPRFEYDNFRAEISGVTELARKWHTEFSWFEYRLLPILPAAGYFITDPGQASKTVKVELYTARPWKPFDTRPHIVIDEGMPEWRDYFIQQFRNYWALSKAPW